MNRKTQFVVFAFVWAFMAMKSMILAADWNLSQIETTRWRGQYYDLTIDDDRLYLACKRGVEIYSISDPLNPEMIGNFLTDGLANGVAVHFPYIYVGDVYGFNIWNISDPANAIRLGGFKRESEEGYQERLTYRDDLVYIAAYSSGLQIVDVSDPLNPYILGQEKTEAYSWDLALKDDTAFMMDFFSMQIINVSRPDAPIKVTAFEAMFAGGIALRENTAYIAFVDGLLVLDISNPTEPQILANIGPTGGGAGESVTLKGDYAILAHQSYVEIYDVSVPSEPMQVSFFYPPGHPRKVLAHKNFLYTILDDNGFLITDITDPENPVQGPHIDTSVWGSRQDVGVKDGFLYLCDWNRGLVIYDILEEGTVSPLSEYATPGSLNDITFDGNFAYLPCYTELQVIDISDPGSPFFVGSYDTSGSPWGVTIRNNLAFLCDFYSFQILDVSDPSNIERISAIFLAQNGVPYRSVLNGDIAYVAYGWGGLLMIDISDPNAPEVVKQWPEDNSVNYSTLFLKDDILFALNTSKGVDFIDVSNPLDPQLITTYDHPNASMADFFIQDNYLYTASTTKGIFMVDISEPGNPITVGHADTPGEAVGITVSNEFVFVADDFDLAVYEQTGKRIDQSPPDIQINHPNFNDKIRNKVAVIYGVASDQASGVRYVEVSKDGGNQWMKAKGQESWSYSLSGVSSGFVTIRARAVDWAGNITESTENVSFYMNVQSPLILMAGFERSHLWQNQESTVTFGMFVSDPFGMNYVENIDIYLDGEFIGTSLELKSISSGIAYYQAQMPLEFAQSERKRYSFIAWDKYENFSHVWPYLCVRP